MSPKLILASTSPFRRELLSRLHLEFQADAPAIDEDAYKKQGLTPESLASLLALKKAKSLKSKYPNSVIIGSDQVVSLGAEIFSKPGTAEKAKESLARLSGKTHKIITAIAIIGPQDQVFEHLDVTHMHMRSLTTEEISNYVSLETPLNSAGSYKIEGLGISLFDKIESADTTAIIGLPLLKLSQILRQLGYKLP